MLGLHACHVVTLNRPALVAHCCCLHNCTSSALKRGQCFRFPTFVGDPNSNWAWFEKQKSASVDFKLRFSTGDTSKIDHMDHNGVTASATWRNAGGAVAVALCLQGLRPGICLQGVQLLASIWSCWQVQGKQCRMGL